MKGEAKAFKLPPLGHQFLIFWAVLCLILVGFTDIALPSALGQSDYLMTFHTAGYIAAHGLWPILYPPPEATTFAAAPFDKQAHLLITSMPSWSVGEYMYMPLSAFVFAPLSLLAPVPSIIAWQLISLACLYAGCALALGSGSRGLLGACAALTFLPVVFTLWIGQVGLVFGLLPLAAGFHLLGRKQDLAAGLVFSLLTLKPQMLVPAIFMMAVCAALNRWRPIAGLLGGSAVLALLNLAFNGPTLCLAWLRCLALSDRVYSDPAQGVAVHLATSLPRALLLSQPLASHGIVKPLLTLLALGLLAAGITAAVKLAKSSLGERDKLIAGFLLGALALPMVVPHVFLYDLGALVPAALLVLLHPDGLQAPALIKRLRLIVFVEWITITAYCLLMVSNKAFAMPLLMVSLMLACYGAAIHAIFKTSKTS